MVDEFKLPMEIIDRKVTKMKMISPSNREVDVGKTLSEREWIGMCRREVRIRLIDSWGALLASVHGMCCTVSCAAAQRTEMCRSMACTA